MLRSHATFVIKRAAPHPHLFVISGDIVEGVIRRGMVAQLTDRSGLGFSERVYGVQFVDIRSAQRAEVGPTFSPASPEQLTHWRSIEMVGQTLIIVDPGSA